MYPSMNHQLSPVAPPLTPGEPPSLTVSHSPPHSLLAHSHSPNCTAALLPPPSSTHRGLGLTESQTLPFSKSSKQRKLDDHTHSPSIPHKNCNKCFTAYPTIPLWPPPLSKGNPCHTPTPKKKKSKAASNANHSRRHAQVSVTLFEPMSFQLDLLFPSRMIAPVKVGWVCVCGARDRCPHTLHNLPRFEGRAGQENWTLAEDPGFT